MHHSPWLKHSNVVSREGVALLGFCEQYGFEKMVKKATRGTNLLDRVLTNLDGCVSTKVLPPIADHDLVLATVLLPVATAEVATKTLWDFPQANWGRLQKYTAGNGLVSHRRVAS